MVVRTRWLYSYALLISLSDAFVLIISMQNRVLPKQKSYRLTRWYIIQPTRRFKSHPRPPCEALRPSTLAHEAWATNACDLAATWSEYPKL